jgi:ribosomal-protein-alanine N-acetyltransferase
MSYQRSKVVSVKPARVSDVSQILCISEACGLDFWSESAYVNAISDEQSALFCFHLNHSIVGFIVGRIPILPDTAAEIFNIGISPAYRRRGYGSMLLKEFIGRCYDAHLTEIWLEVRESNLGAIQLYEHAGFKATSRRKHFYSIPTEDALLMTFSLRNT